MVRSCAVEGCSSSDVTILSHRFPRCVKRALVWQKELKLEKIPLNELIEKYTICSLHFEKSDYRNSESRFLNTTSVPKLKTKKWNSSVSNKTENNENIEYINVISSTTKVYGSSKTIDTECSITNNNIDIEEECETDNNLESNENDHIIEQDLDDNYYIILDFGAEKGGSSKTKSDPTNLDDRPRKGLKRKYIETETIENVEMISSESEENNQEFNEKVDGKNEEINVTVNSISVQTEFQGEDEAVEESNFPGHEYSKLTKIDLIGRLIESEEKIKELQKTIEGFQESRAKMLETMEALKMLV